MHECLKCCIQAWYYSEEGHVQVLLPAARERLARIALVKPEKARGVEDLVLQAAQRGQIVERVRSTPPPPPPPPPRSAESSGLGQAGARHAASRTHCGSGRPAILERVRCLGSSHNPVTCPLSELS